MSPALLTYLYCLYYKRYFPNLIQITVCLYNSKLCNSKKSAMWPGEVVSSADIKSKYRKLIPTHLRGL